MKSTDTCSLNAAECGLTSVEYEEGQYLEALQLVKLKVNFQIIHINTKALKKSDENVVAQWNRVH